jgi:aldehyde:ferredoxin oxidoreductase
MGAAIFWDLCKDKAISGLDPGNVISIMTSPLSGTITPMATGRTEVQAIAVESYPVEWFTRSNFGGRFAAMLKFAGWDGIVVEGRADEPVWLDLRGKDVQIRHAGWLWGLDTWETQQQIWSEVSGSRSYGDWWELGESAKGGRTTQLPAMLTIGPAGENLCRYAVLLHDAANAAGQGGFGGVFGSKNLKAISVIGSGSVKVANPKALLDARMQEEYTRKRSGPRVHAAYWPPRKALRPQGCTACDGPCRGRYERYGNEAQCMETVFSMMFTQRDGASHPDAVYMAGDVAERYGINVYQALRGIEYTRDLNKMGVLGKGQQIACDLPFDRIADVEFAERFLRMIAYREGVGDDFAEGFPRAAEKWGRAQEDFETGVLQFPYWGYAEHNRDPRCDVQWGYGSILAERDCNEHGLSLLAATFALNTGREPPTPAEELVKTYAAKLYPYEGDPRMLDFSTENMYSEHMAKLVSWQRDYSRFWKHSMLYCDLRYPRLWLQGATEAEPRFLNAVTGGKTSFVQGMEAGRRIWNLDNAIWALQGRHRDMVQFADYIYSVPYAGWGFPLSGWLYYLPGIEHGEWKYIKLDGRHLDRARFEGFKTRFYEFEGWDPATGWLKRSTLEAQGLGYLADELERHGKLGKE